MDLPSDCACCSQKESRFVGTDNSQILLSQITAAWVPITLATRGFSLSERRNSSKREKTSGTEGRFLFVNVPEMCRIQLFIKWYDKP